MTNQINGLRGGAMGMVSGVKGGALAGALGGLGQMVAQSWTTGEWSAVVYTALLGLTLGLMAGAVVGLGLGVVAGAVSGVWLGRGRAYAVPWVWGGLAAVWGCWLGWQMVGHIAGAAVGLLLGLLAAGVSQRDFQQVVQMQTETEAGETP